MVAQAEKLATGSLDAQAKVRDDSSSFFYKRLFSLVGIVPIGAYVVLHLYDNGHSVRGALDYDQYLEKSRSIPYYTALVWLFIYLPIAFHGIYGLVIVKRGKPNIIKYHWFRNLKYFLQRLSGVGLLLFIPAHIYKTRLEPSWKGYTIDYRHMVEAMHDPLTLIVYVLGITGVAFHLANGIWDFCYTWGITVGPRSQKTFEVFSILVFVGLMALGLNAIRGFFP